MLRLKFERTSRGLSQRELAVIVRLHQPQIALIETRQLTPTPAQLQRLADAFGVQPAELLQDVAVLVSR